ncbi:hypothetical protein BSKO_11727 [Bryopsis sp. KO-2023]|nr:hypothetical protein BSKO_11727 [Bryopsis sp. KO-2023]
MTLFGGQLSYIAVTVLAVKLLYSKRFSLSAFILAGLLQYEITALDESATGQSESQPASVSKDSLSAKATTKKRRKRIEKEKRTQMNLGIADKIVQVCLSREALEETEFFDVYDNLVFFGVIVLVNNLAGAVGQYFLQTPNTLAPILTVAGAMIGIYSLAKVEVFSDLTPRREKMSIAVIGLVGFFLSFFILLLAPVSVINFRIEPAAANFKQAMDEGIRSLGKQDQGSLPSVNLDPIVLAFGLAIFAGGLSAVLFTAVTRVIRCHQLMLFPPEQLKEHLFFGLVPKTLVQGQMLLVVACCIFWLDPLVEIFELSNDSLQKLRIAVFLVWAAVQISLIRPLMQAYFHGALVQWYNLRHFGGTKKDEDHISKQIQMKVMVNTYIACKVAIQVLAPPLILACWSSLMLSRGIPSLAPPDQGMFRTDFVFCIAGFLGWWTCLSWAVYSMLTLSMFRMGLLIS